MLYFDNTTLNFEETIRHAQTNAIYSYQKHAGYSMCYFFSHIHFVARMWTKIISGSWEDIVLGEDTGKDVSLARISILP